MEQYTISDPKLLEQKIALMQLGGAEKLHILADFDRTLTKGFYEGKTISSIASFLYEDGSISNEYQREGKALFDYYYPIEIDHTIDRNEKKKAMDIRRSEHLKLMIKHKLSKKDIEKVIVHKELQLRQYADAFFNILHTQKIPTVIMSASGIGYDSIGLYLKRQRINQQYIDIVSNAFIRDDAGYAIGRKAPVIHSMNKNEIAIHMFPDVYKKISDRKNVILLGDSLHDVEMIDGFDHDVCIRIGFCNIEKEEVIELFSQTFDIVILHDGSMHYPVDLVTKILQ